MFFAFLALACSPPAPVATPAALSAFGYEDVRFDLAQVELSSPVVGVEVGGVAAFHLRPESDAITVTVQGSPVSGEVPVALLLEDGSTAVFDKAFVYEEPAADIGELWSLGASVAMGVQGGGIAQRGQLLAPSAQVARQLGLFHPLPLFVPDLLPNIDPSEVGAAPGCEIPDLGGVATSSASHAFKLMEDPDSEGPNLRLGREDPNLMARNLSVAGTRMEELLDGYSDEDFTQQFLAHLVLQPEQPLFDPVTVQQVDVLDAATPGVVLLPDFIGNDLVDAILASDVLDPSLAHGPDEVGGILNDLVDRLAATGAEVFAANMPLLSTTPLAMDLARSMVRDGSSEAEVQDLLDRIDAKVTALNDALAAAADRHPNVHLVDAAGEVQRVADGVLVGDEQVGTWKFGGLISSDGIHFSDTGSAMLANGFLDAMADELGIDAPRVDLEPMLAGDPYAPNNLTAAGIDAVRCDIGLTPSAP